MGLHLGFGFQRPEAQKVYHLLDSSRFDDGRTARDLVKAGLQLGDVWASNSR